MAFEVFDDVAFFYLATALLAIAVLPWTAFKVWKYSNDKKRAQKKETLKNSAEAKKIPHDPKNLDCECVVCERLRSSIEAKKPKESLFSFGNITLAILWLLFIYLLFLLPTFQSAQLQSFKPYEILGIDVNTPPPQEESSEVAVGEEADKKKQEEEKKAETIVAPPPPGRGKRGRSRRPSDDEPAPLLHRVVSEKEIQRAYRKMSLKWHPDKHFNLPTKEEAEQKFLLINKAYHTLTDPVAKANLERYGNPDGYQGVSVTIGLPSFLTKKENEKRVLILYFLIFIALPPLLTYLWWNKAKNYLDGNILKQTAYWFEQNLGPNMGPAFLLELLSLAGEYQELVSPQRHTQENLKELTALYIPLKQQIRHKYQELLKAHRAAADPSFAQHAKNPSVVIWDHSLKAQVLFMAYLKRVTIPASLRPDVDLLLLHSHRILQFALSIALGRQYSFCVQGIFDLMQCLCQALHWHDSQLLQLPSVSDNEVRKIISKKPKLNNVAAWKRLDREKRSKFLADNLTEEQWIEHERVIESLPEIEVDYTVQVEDEEGIYEGDLVLLSVNLKRIEVDAKNGIVFDPSKKDAKGKQTTATADDIPSLPTMRTTVGDGNGDVEGRLGSLVMEAQRARVYGVDDDDTVKDKEVTVVEAKAPTPAPATLASLSDDAILDALPVPKSKKKLPELGASGPLVHSLYFPHKKHEKWYVVLLEKPRKKSPRILAIEKLSSGFFETAELELRFFAPIVKKSETGEGKEGKLHTGGASSSTNGSSCIWEYELLVMNDSYLGCDRSVPFRMKVSKPQIQKDASADKKKKDVCKDEDGKIVEDEVDDCCGHSHGGGSDDDELKPGVRPEYKKILQSEYEELESPENQKSFLEKLLEDPEDYDAKWYYLGFASFWEMVLNLIVLGLLLVLIYNQLLARGYWQKYFEPVTSYLFENFWNPFWTAVYPHIKFAFDPAAEYVFKAWEWIVYMLHTVPADELPDLNLDEVPGMGEE